MRNKFEDKNSTYSVKNDSIGTDLSYKFKINWGFAVPHIIYNILTIYGLSYIPSSHSLTIFFAFGLIVLTFESVAIGAHKLYSHRSFKATVPVKLVLIIIQTMSGQYSVYRWAKDHRLHHKFCNTDADPVNTARSFFFAHYGWLLVHRHPMCLEKMKQIDDSDLRADKLVMFQKQHYWKLHFLLGMGISTAIPVYLWNESFLHAFFVCYLLRMMFVVHMTSAINSFSHTFGDRPFDKNIPACDKKIIHYINNEGFHNFHHAFPWDYRNHELGVGSLSTMVLDALASMGLISNLKFASIEMIKARVLRTGDGSYHKYHKQVS